MTIIYCKDWMYYYTASVHVRMSTLMILIIFKLIASEASCANLTFLVYIFIYLYICMLPYVLFGPARAPVTRNAQTSDRPVEVQRSI